MKISEFVVDKLDFCGCFNDEIIENIVDVFKLFDIKDEEDPPYYTEIAKQTGLSENYVELILYILDSKGWLEHGTAVRGSWLSEEGKDMLDKIKNGFDPDEE